MPLVAANPRGLLNGNTITQFTDTTNTTSVTFTYPTSQTNLIIENSGEHDIFVTVGSVTNQQVVKDTKWRYDGSFTSFDIRSDVNSQEFIATAIIQGLDDFTSINNQLNDVNSSLAEKASQSYVDGQIQNMSSQVQGFYSTVSALTTAFPAGNTNNYVVTADSYIYRWNGSVWVSTGFLFNTAALATGSVTELKTTFFDTIQGKNLFNPSAVTTGSYVVQTNGTFSSTTGKERTDYIPITAGTYYFSSFSQNIDFRWALYDNSKTYLSGGTDTLPNFDGTKSNRFYSNAITVAQDGYIVMSLATGINNIQFEKGAYTAYEAYYHYYNIKNDYLTAVNQSISQSTHPKMYVKKTGNAIAIKYKYKSGYDTIQNFGLGGANNNPVILTASTVPNSSQYVSNDFTPSPTTLMQVSTDLVSPYVIDAVNNINGDTVPVGGFTGGWHGINDLTGAATAKNYRYDLYIDNQLTTADGTYQAETVKIVTVNQVQARNTVKADGTGREVMKETVTYTFEPGKIDAEITIEALETITLNTWYAFQSYNASYANQIIFKGDNINNLWQTVQGTAGTFYRAGTKTDSDLSVIAHKNTNGDYLELWLDRNYATGKMRYLSSTEFIAMMNRIDSGTTVKSYWYILDTPTTLNTGQSLSARGGWKLYNLAA